MHGTAFAMPFVKALRFVHGRLGWTHSEHHVMNLARRLKPLRRVPVRMTDGRVLYLDLRNPVSLPYLLQGDFPCEQEETQLVRCLVRPGDTVVDIGANVGWYASLLSDLVGPGGRVFAFEPNPELVALLLRLEAICPALYTVHGGVADRDGTAEFNLPENWISGSFGATQSTVRSCPVRLYSLDDFLERQEVGDVSFIKCDAEGAELSVLQGACRTLGSGNPAMWLMEFSSEEAAKFGYHPRLIHQHFEGECAGLYRSFIVDRDSGRLAPFEMPDEDPFWFNALYVPERFLGRVKRLVKTPASAISYSHQ